MLQKQIKELLSIRLPRIIVKHPREDVDHILYRDTNYPHHWFHFNFISPYSDNEKDQSILAVLKNNIMQSQAFDIVIKYNSITYQTQVKPTLSDYKYPWYDIPYSFVCTQEVIEWEIEDLKIVKDNQEISHIDLVMDNLPGQIPWLVSS